MKDDKTSGKYAGCRRHLPATAKLRPLAGIAAAAGARTAQVRHLRRCIWTARLIRRTIRSACTSAAYRSGRRDPREPARCFMGHNMSRSNVNGMPGRQAISPRGKVSFCVTLRSAKVTASNGARLAMPARESSAAPIPEQEWREIDNKAAGLRTLIANGCVLSRIFPTHNSIIHLRKLFILSPMIDTGQTHVP